MRVYHNRRAILHLTLVALLGGTSCGRNFAVFQGMPSSTPTPGGVVPTPTPGGVVPPTPVIGSYLTGILYRSDGGTYSNTKVGIEDRSFETTTTDLGEFTLPVSEITRKTISVEIVTAKRVIFADVEIPDELVKEVNQARVDTSMPPIEGQPPVKPANKLPNGTPPPTIFKHKLGLILPDNFGGVPTDESTNQIIPAKQKITVASLPNTEVLQDKSVGMWTTVENLSVEGSARFQWQNGFSDAALVRVVFSKSMTDLSKWDGRKETIPLWPGAAAGINVVSDFSACTDQDFRTSESGQLSSSGLVKCGILRTGFPFSNRDDIFVRLVGESLTEIKLSAVFTLRRTGSNTAPKLSEIPSQTTESNKPRLNIPLDLTDNETQLACASSIKALSSNPEVLANDGIVVGGTAPNCQISLFPIRDGIGLTEIRILASDGELTAIQKFDFEVRRPITQILSMQPAYGISAESGLRGQVKLGWIAPKLSEEMLPYFSGFKIHRDTSERFSPSANNLIATLPATQLDYTDAAVTNGTRYYYKVVAFYSSIDALPDMEAVALPLSPAAPADPAHVFVSPNGNDLSGDGSLVNPFQTIEKAVATVCS